MSTIKVDTVRPVTTDADLALQGDASGAGVTGAKVFGDGSLGADSITDLAGTGAPDFPYGLKNKIYKQSHNTDSGYTASGVFKAFGTSLSISSSENPNGAKFLVIAGGGRVNSSGSGLGLLRYTETNDFSGGSADGTTLEQVSSTSIFSSSWMPSGIVMGIYTNSSGSSKDLYIRTAVYGISSSDSRWYGDGDEPIGLIAMRIR